MRVYPEVVNNSLNTAMAKEFLTARVPSEKYLFLMLTPEINASGFVRSAISDGMEERGYDDAALNELVERALANGDELDQLKENHANFDDLIESLKTQYEVSESKS